MVYIWMTFEEFVENLPYVDWYYGMADDGESYRRGKAQVDRYREIAKENGGKWLEAFRAQEEKHRIG